RRRRQHRRGAPLTGPVGSPALAQDLRGDGKHRFAALVAALRVEDQEAALGTRFEVDLVGKASPVANGVADQYRPWPGQVLEPGRGPVAGERDALGGGSGAGPLAGADQAADIVGGGVPAGGGERAKQRSLRRGLIEVRVPVARKGDDAVLGE